jgi:hypothetical protein
MFLAGNTISEYRLQFTADVKTEGVSRHTLRPVIVHATLSDAAACRLILSQVLARRRSSRRRRTICSCRGIRLRSS